MNLFKIIFLTIFSFIFLFADNNMFNDNVFSQGISKDKTTNKILSNDYDVVTMEHLKANLANNPKVVSANNENIFFNNKKLLKKEAILLKKKENKPKYKQFYINGYCVLNHMIEISRLSAIANLNCNFNKGNGTLTTLLVPDIYSKAVVGKPLYITFNNKPNKKYFVIGGVLMNAQQTSINLASVVNDRKIDRFLAKTGIDSANIVTQNALAYLETKLQSNTQEQVTYLNTNNGITPVKTQNTKPPKVSDYLKVTALQLLSNLVKNVSDAFYQDLPYLFKINKNSMFYCDLYVTDEYQGLPSINKNTNNLVVKNPLNSKQPTSQIILKGINNRNKQ